MRTFLSLCIALALSTLAHSKPLNLLIVTVDDMSCDSMGVYGCPVPDTSPRMDRLASECLRFEHAHVVVGNCMPSRNVMWSGRYPHNNGVEGFYQVPDATHPHLVDLMQKAGYLTAIRGKVSHSTPYHPYHWDLDLDTLPDGSKAHIKDAESYGISTQMGIDAAKTTGKPFCVMINISDPHKPFYAEGKGGMTVPDEHVPSRVFTPEEMVVPGFLFDDPVVRKELSHYYSSVRRADDCLGRVLDVLEASGEKDNTAILFLSDHGMPLPFAKTQVYHHSTNTPLMVRWPGVTKAGAVDGEHMVSAVDILPTLLDILELPHPEGFDGRSFAPLLKGESQENRDFVIKEYNENAGASRDPMRAIQTKDMLYIFNPWSNGERVFATATSGTSTYKRMAELAKEDSVIEARHDLYQHRVVEELYQTSNDADCLHNLINDPGSQDTLADLQAKLEQWMTDTHDHCLTTFQKRDDPAAMEAYVIAKEAESAERRASKSKGKGAKKTPAKRKNLLNWTLPEGMPQPGKTVGIDIQHKLTDDLGEQLLHVTLKQGSKGNRVDRKVITIQGKGTEHVEFTLPESITDDQIQFAAFVGPEFSENLQIIQSDPIATAKAE